MSDERDIFDELADASRRLVAGRKLPEGELPWESIEQVRRDFRRWHEASGRTLDQVARSLGEGFAATTLHKWLAATGVDNVGCDMQRMTRGINQFIETEGRRSKVAKPPGWVETEVARRMLLVIAKAIELNSIGLIYSDAGRGKSLTLQAAAAIFPGSILVRIVTGAHSPAGLTRLLYQASGLRGNSRKASLDQLGKLIDHLRDSDRAILIDEAHRLTPEALEVIRDLHDECGVPFVLVGTHRINEMCSDVDLFYGQFTSRIAIRYDVTEAARGAASGSPSPSSRSQAHVLHTVDEIRRLYESDKVRFTGDGLTFLASLANALGLGGLRLCTKLVMVAAQVATAESAARIDAKLLRRVLRRLHGSDFTTHQIERAVTMQPALAAIA